MNDSAEPNNGADVDQRRSMLVCRVDSRLCALPLENVVETMRPLMTEPLIGAPSFVLGVSVIRGEPLPVVDAAALLGAEESHPTRLVTLGVNGRRVALAVDAVLGVRRIPGESLHALPPLLDGAGTEVISAIGALDAEFLVVMGSARLVPDAVWSLVGHEMSTS